MKKIIVLFAVCLFTAYACSKQDKDAKPAIPAVNITSTIHIFPRNIKIGLFFGTKGSIDGSVYNNTGNSDSSCFYDFIYNAQVIYKGYAVGANAGDITNNQLWTQVDNSGDEQGYVSAYWELDIPSYINLNSSSITGAGAIVSTTQSQSISSYAQGSTVRLMKTYTDITNGQLQMSSYSIRVDYILTHQLYCSSYYFKPAFGMATDCGVLGTIYSGVAYDTITKHNPPPQAFDFSGAAQNGSHYLVIGLPGFCTCTYCDLNNDGQSNLPLDYEIQYRIQGATSWTTQKLNPLSSTYNAKTNLYSYTISFPTAGTYEVRARTHIAEGVYSAWYGSGNFNINNILFGIDSSSVISIP